MLVRHKFEDLKEILFVIFDIHFIELFVIFSPTFLHHILAFVPLGINIYYLLASLPFVHEFVSPNHFIVVLQSQCHFLHIKLTWFRIIE